MKKGSLTLITGCMFSGKTKTLISKIKGSKKKCVLVKPTKDTRYNREIKSHDGLKLEKKDATVIECKDLNDDVIDKVMGFDWIGIDEAQFFKTLKHCVKLANAGKEVIVAGLCSDFEREPFPSVCELLPQCDDVIFCKKAKCFVCGEPASCSKRLVCSPKKILIGGKESYQPSCRSCHDIDCKKFNKED